MEIIGRIEEYLRKKGFCTIIMGYGGDLAKTVDLLLFQDVGGLLIYPELTMKDLDKFNLLRSMDFPFVLMSSDGKDYGLDTVYMDRRLGAYKATMHLISLGHRRIGFIFDDNMKLEGYMQALKENDIRYNKSLVTSGRGNNCQGGYDACAELLDRRNKMTALFCSTYIYAIGAVKCCRRRGLHIPEEIAIVGSDNLEEGAFTEIPLTTIAYNFQEKTEIAVELLFKRMREGYKGIKNENIALEPEVIIRESTIGKKKPKAKGVNRWKK